MVVGLVRIVFWLTLIKVAERLEVPLSVRLHATRSGKCQVMLLRKIILTSSASSSGEAENWMRVRKFGHVKQS